MIRISAKKKMDVRRIECLLEIKINKHRPDLIWYLNNLGSWGFTRGEQVNMEDYLEYLGLIRRGELTQEGEKAIETNQVMMPETGLYEILCTKDTVFGNRVINFKRIHPIDILEGDTQDFSDYKLFDEKIFCDMSDGKKTVDEFWIKFQRQRGTNPKVIDTGSLESELVIMHENQETVMTFTFNKNNIKIQHRENIGKLDIDSNINRWLKGWDKNISAMEMTYEEAKKNRAILKNFQTTKVIHGQQLITPFGVDEGNWSIELFLPVVPKTMTDVKKWLGNIIIDNLTEKPRYLSKTKLKELHNEMLENTPIMKKHGSYRQSGEDLIKFLKEDNDQTNYYMVMAVEDLFPVTGGFGV